MKRRIIVAGNWKMNKNLQEVRAFYEQLSVNEGPSEILIAPPLPFIKTCVELSEEVNRPITVTAQNCHQESNGAFTGEVSSEMIASCQAKAVIIGHSERRALFNESDQLLNEKTKGALKSGLKVVFCCGEKKEERESGLHFKVVKTQLLNGLKKLTIEDYSNVIIAYEPVWAIGTGLTASSEQAEEMHAFIRDLMPEQVRPEIAILYGGSVKPSNFEELLSQPNIDGGLVGGASLDATSFSELVQIGDQIMGQ